MAKKPNTRVRFLGGHAPRIDLLGLLAFPVVLDGRDDEHTRFFTTTSVKWVHKAIDADIVSVTYERGAEGWCWWLLGKRGDVYAVRPGGVTREVITDAGTGAGKFGYLRSLKLIDNRLVACGFCRQVYERTTAGWIHQDQGILLGAETMDSCLNDIADNADRVLCAVGDEGEIAFQTNSSWAMFDSPTNEHLYAVCTDDQGRFCAAGANGTVVRGNAAGMEVLCTGGEFDEVLWDIEFHEGQLVVSATAGLFVVRDGVLVPFDKPSPPDHAGYKLTTVDGALWSIGTHQVMGLVNGVWTEWVCPDNAP